MRLNSSAHRAERLRLAGLKVTAPRLAILDALEQDRSHPSAEELFESLAESHPSLSRSTVYTTLASFIRAGLVRKLPEVDGRLRVDGTRTEHDHAYCRSCGAIFDIDRAPLPPPPAPSELPGGLEVLNVRLEYEVICASCREAG